MAEQKERIPPSLIGLLGSVLIDDYTHDGLNSLFLSASAPGDPPEGSKVNKVQEWLRRTNKEHDEPLKVLGDILGEYLDTPHLYGDDAPDEWTARRTRVRDALAKEGLIYQRGGRIFGRTLGEPSRTLEEEIRRRNVPAIEQEFRRAYENVERDPPAAVTAACAILESICKTYLEESNLPVPSKLSLGPLWDAAREGLKLTDANVSDEDLRKVLKGLSSIADGVGSLRSHAGSAHGRSAAARTRERAFRIEPRHARLAVHAAHTLALFVLDTWSVRKSGAKT
jgi:hypothetical protein